MNTFFKRKYRVRFIGEGYVAEYKDWFSPFWQYCFWICYKTKEEAVESCNNHNNRITNIN